MVYFITFSAKQVIWLALLEKITPPILPPPPFFTYLMFRTYCDKRQGGNPWDKADTVKQFIRSSRHGPRCKHLLKIMFYRGENKKGIKILLPLPCLYGCQSETRYAGRISFVAVAGWNMIFVCLGRAGGEGWRKNNWDCFYFQILKWKCVLGFWNRSSQAKHFLSACLNVSIEIDRTSFNFTGTLTVAFPPPVNNHNLLQKVLRFQMRCHCNKLIKECFAKGFRSD